MALERIYNMSFSNISVAAVQDLLAIYTGSSMAISIHEVKLFQISSTVIGNLRVRLLLLTPTVTSGSGGAAGTISPLKRTDAAATVTGRINDTVQATTNGSTVVLDADGVNVLNGYQFLPLEQDRPVIGLSSAFVVSLDTAPASSQTWNGTIKFGERF